MTIQLSIIKRRERNMKTENIEKLEQYEKLEIEVIEFEEEDVITTNYDPD